jgi:hypothetical protein
MIRTPFRMNPNAMTVKEFKYHKANDGKYLQQKLASQKTRAGIFNNKFISNMKWKSLKSFLLNGNLGALVG